MTNPTPEELAHGVADIAKKHERDIKDVAWYVGIMLVPFLLIGGCTALIHLHHPDGPTSPTCYTQSDCDRYIRNHPVHVKPMPGFPLYHPITPTTVG